MAKTLLLVDDSVTVQRVVELTFSHEDIRVISVSDGRRAVQALDTDGADLVLVDVEVPEIDGYGVAAHMRKSERLRDVPVLLMSGALGTIDEKRARDLGVAAVLTKPFEPQALVKKVKELLTEGGGAPAGARTAGPTGLRPARYQAGRTPEPLEPSRKPVWDSSASPASSREPAPKAPAEPQRRSLVDAFSALIGAESTKAAPPPAAGPSAGELEDAVRRVLQQMTAAEVRQIVAETAERLVREEIDRIKAAESD
ncbi:MAG TPA: response regulator [Vicinamibacterales bacterium]|nr:response regulator [Vicinamibacterales bacterium]